MDEAREWGRRYDSRAGLDRGPGHAAPGAATRECPDMSRLTWFEIHAAEPARAMRFYGGLLGWTFESFGDDYWLIHTGDPSAPGIDGGLMPRRGPPPADGAPVNAYTCVVNVPDVDIALVRAAQFGGAVVTSKFAVPSVGWLAYVRDTEGNVFGVMTMDERAA